MTRLRIVAVGGRVCFYAAGTGTEAAVDIGYVLGSVQIVGDSEIESPFEFRGDRYVPKVAIPVIGASMILSPNPFLRKHNANQHKF